MAKTSVDIPQLKFNKMSTAKYEELKLAGQLNDNEFYITPDGGTIPEINETTNDFVLSNNGTDLNWIQETEYTKNRIDSKLNDNVRTNCITKIPQDIKLELSEDGVLTLKAGSKVYIPNGVGIFDEVVIDTDKTITSTFNITAILFLENTGNLRIFGLSQVFSGDTAPSGQQYLLWYDTSTNKIKLTENSGSTWIEGQSFPLGVINISSTQITSIDQVFNGFGYIGSTIFALPGIEGLIPNGRNADGSLNNTKFTTTNVSIIPQVEVNRGIAFFIDGSNNINTWGSSGGNVLYFKTRPSVAPRTYCRAHIEDENRWIASADTTAWTETLSICHCGNLQSESTGKVTSFSPKNVFQAIDRNDTNWLSKLSLPSNTIIPLTLEASGTRYTAPANGWVTIGGGCTGFVSLYNVSNNLVSMIAPRPDNYNFARTYIPVKKGDTFGVDYALFTVEVFHFIYAEGEI